MEAKKGGDKIYGNFTIKLLPWLNITKHVINISFLVDIISVQKVNIEVTSG